MNFIYYFFILWLLNGVFMGVFGGLPIGKYLPDVTLIFLLFLLSDRNRVVVLSLMMIFSIYSDAVTSLPLGVHAIYYLLVISFMELCGVYIPTHTSNKFLKITIIYLLALISIPVYWLIVYVMSTGALHQDYLIFEHSLRTIGFFALNSLYFIPGVFIIYNYTEKMLVKYYEK